jgi:serine/threonine protein phosphatase 1
MSNKYFIVSDLHSFYTPLKNALKRKKFDINNPNHILVVAGDLFDRGNETIKLYEFLKSIPEDRLILIRGNHEDLYEALLLKFRPQWNDVSNGTVKTFCHIAGIKKNSISVSEWQDVLSKVGKHEITAFIHGITRSVFEIGDYIICHARPGDVWGNPYCQSKVPGKTIIFGHWQTSDGANFIDGELKDGIFYADGLIGIDNGVQIKNGRLYHKQNVLVIEV